MAHVAYATYHVRSAVTIKFSSVFLVRTVLESKQIEHAQELAEHKPLLVTFAALPRASCLVRFENPVCCRSVYQQ